MFFKKKNTIVNNLLRFACIYPLEKKKKLYIQYFEVEGFKY